MERFLALLKDLAGGLSLALGFRGSRGFVVEEVGEGGFRAGAEEERGVWDGEGGCLFVVEDIVFLGGFVEDMDVGGCGVWCVVCGSLGRGEKD